MRSTKRRRGWREGCRCWRCCQRTCGLTWPCLPTVGLAVLDRIRRLDYDVWTRRPTVGRLDKLRILIQSWWRLRRGHKRRKRFMIRSFDTVKDSYSVCHRVARRSHSNFYPCFCLLDGPKRRGMESALRLHAAHRRSGRRDRDALAKKSSTRPMGRVARSCVGRPVGIVGQRSERDYLARPDRHRAEIQHPFRVSTSGDPGRANGPGRPVVRDL